MNVSDNLPLPAMHSVSYSGAVRGVKSLDVTVRESESYSPRFYKVPELFWRR